MPLDGFTVRPASADDLAQLAPLVRAYHDFEGIQMDDGVRTSGLLTLLQDATLGQVLVACDEEALVGYVALCYGFSLEFGGRDGFIDELFVLPAGRGTGIGTALLREACEAGIRNGLRVVHLEVARSNDRARALYASMGFQARDQFALMSYRLPEN